MRWSRSTIPARRCSPNSLRGSRQAGVDVAFARLELVRAQQSFARQGLEAVIGRDHLFHSVEEAVEALSGPRPE